VDRQTTANGTSEAPTLAAVCGLLCEACTIYIASHEDLERLARIAAGFGQSTEETYCDGCRAEKRMAYCRSCTMFACAAGRGLAFCGECVDYPCAELEAFGRERPHRADIHEDLRRIGEIGPEPWMEEARLRYTCPSCGTINSAYDLECRRCGHDPGSAYVEVHREAIVKRLSES
jgi:hypothetical protein